MILQIMMGRVLIFSSLVSQVILAGAYNVEESKVLQIRKCCGPGEVLDQFEKRCVSWTDFSDGRDLQSVEFQINPNLKSEYDYSRSGL